MKILLLDPFSVPIPQARGRRVSDAFSVPLLLARRRSRDDEVEKVTARVRFRTGHFASGCGRPFCRSERICDGEQISEVPFPHKDWERVLILSDNRITVTHPWEPKTGSDE